MSVMSKGMIIHGMQCEECEKIIEQAVERVSGIEEGSANADADNNAVSFEVAEGGSISVERLVDSVENAGYEGEIPGVTN